jgi:hypothetical protein
MDREAGRAEPAQHEGLQSQHPKGGAHDHDGRDAEGGPHPGLPRRHRKQDHDRSIERRRQTADWHPEPSRPAAGEHDVAAASGPAAHDRCARVQPEVHRERQRRGGQHEGRQPAPRG